MNAAFAFTFESGDLTKRLDHFLQERLPQFSRSRLQAWVKGGRVHVNGAPAKTSHSLHPGDLIEVEPAAPPPLEAAPEDLPVEVLYEDDSVIAINKPAGLVVHAGAGVESGTLVNRLVHRFAALSRTGGDLRPGIVHRLDRGTSGVLLVARTDAAHRALAAQFASRTVEKMYHALVEGSTPASGRIDKPITRDPARRIRMTAKLGYGRASLTEFRALERFEDLTYLEVRIGTGRTHQIRAHLSALGHPVAGDRVYGARAAERIFLHARRISFSSPSTGERVTIEAPLAPELEEWLSRLRGGIYNKGTPA